MTHVPEVLRLLTKPLSLQDINYRGLLKLRNLRGPEQALKPPIHWKGLSFFFNEKAEYYKRIYTPEDWPSFRNAAKMQKAISENPVILTL